MLAVIGGTGLYQIEGMNLEESKRADTPFGQPSAPISIGELEGKRIAFLPRHGSKHEFLPHEINFKANIFALKKMGVERIVSLSATGSLRKEIAPGDIALVSQYFDWTRGRKSSFFGNGLVAHVSTAKPSCGTLAKSAVQAAGTLDIPLHSNKTYGCVEGPRFGTQAESFFLRNLGCDLVGMTNLPEAFLAREAQMCYCTIAIATDYDCWMEDPAEHVTVEKAIALYKGNLGKVKSILASLIRSKETTCETGCRKSLVGAVVSPKGELNRENQSILEVLLK